jgi:hypothetical protein
VFIKTRIGEFRQKVNIGNTCNSRKDGENMENMAFMAIAAATLLNAIGLIVLAMGRR